MYSQHSADQLPYHKTPLDHFESLFHQKFPDKDIQVRCLLFASCFQSSLISDSFASHSSFLQFWRSQLGRFGLSGSHQTSLIGQLSDGLRNRVVFSQLGSFLPPVQNRICSPRFG
jgi:ATP-binding cassette subfamily F protein 2